MSEFLGLLVVAGYGIVVFLIGMLWDYVQHRKGAGQVSAATSVQGSTISARR